MLPAPTTCCICNEPVAFLDLGTEPVCRRQACRWAYRALPAQDVCRACRRPLAIRDRAAGVCAVPRCQHVDYTEQQRQARERHERERTTCCICHTPLTPLEFREGPVCRSQACRWTYQELPKEHLCRVCRRPLAMQDRAAGVCAVPQCQDAEDAEQARRVRERRDRAARELYQRGTARPTVPEPETYPITHLPSLRRKTTRLPKWRQREFHRHLEQLIAGVVATGWEDPPVPPTSPNDPATGARAELDAVSGRACAGCQGHCCLSGGTHAHLTERTIWRYHAAHPTKSPAEVLEAYLARIGPRTYEGSCVYHGRHGCRLPRDMRADLCNQWFCAELREFRADAPADRPVQAFMVWPETEGRFSAAFVDATRTRRVAGKSVPRTVEADPLARATTARRRLANGPGP
jgi:hypothetical protein